MIFDPGSAVIDPTRALKKRIGNLQEEVALWQRRYTQEKLEHEATKKELERLQLAPVVYTKSAVLKPTPKRRVKED